MMGRLRFLTSGESHGKGLIGILEGIPAGLSLPPDDIDRELKRRQKGYGRGDRMKIEHDCAEVTSGVRWGKTTGSPISIFIENRDWKNWQEGMSSEGRHEDSIPAVTRPRPGHADLAGALKYSHTDIRNILERASARETAMRVAIGAVAKRFISEFGINLGSYVIQIGSIRAENIMSWTTDYISDEFLENVDASPVRCPIEEAGQKMMKLIDRATDNGDTIGGVFEVVAAGVPPGLGSHIQWDKRLDARLSQALFSIQAIKAVEVGAGLKMAERFGSEVMDEVFFEDSRIGGQGTGMGFYRKTNNAGGIEGGMTNGMPVVMRASMKPIPTLKRPLSSVDIITKRPFEAAYERSDTCAVPSASIIGEAMTAIVIADAFLEKFGGDSMVETKRNFDSFMEYLRQF